MFRNSLFLALGLMVTFALGCEKKEEAPAAPTTQDAHDAVDGHTDDAHDAIDEMKKDAADTAGDVKDATKDAVKKAAEKTEEAAKDVQDAMSN